MRPLSGQKLPVDWTRLRRINHRRTSELTVASLPANLRHDHMDMRDPSYRTRGEGDLACPSSARVATPSEIPNVWDESKVFIFGIVVGTPEQPQVIYLPEPEPITPELKERCAPITIPEVFRVTSPCVEAACPQWNDKSKTCSVAERLVINNRPVVDKLPPCAIRASCRWWHQLGKEACLRCPGIVTDCVIGEPMPEAEIEYL